MDLRSLRCFVAVAERLNFTAAATSLNLAQPALSRTIKELETHLGAPLLVRDTRNVRLTDIGKFFLEEARQALNHVSRAEHIARGMARGELGRLTIGYTTFVGHDLLAPLVKQFRQGQPNVRIELSNAPSDRQRVALLEQKTDIALTLGPCSIPGIASIPIREEPLAVVMPGDHPLAEKTAVTVADLRGEKLIMGSESMWSVYRRTILSEFEREGVPPQIAFEAPTTEIIFSLVSAGMGLTVFPMSYSQYQSQQYPENFVACRPFAAKESKILIICAWGKDNPNPALPAMLRCMRYFRSVAARCIFHDEASR